MSKQCAEGHVWENGNAVCDRCGGADIYSEPVSALTETDRKIVEEAEIVTAEENTPASDEGTPPTDTPEVDNQDNTGENTTPDTNNTEVTNQ